MVKRALALFLFVSPELALASDESEGQAQRLFDEGRTLLTAGRTAEACERFAASEKLSRAGGTIINLAECWLKLGRTASAYGRFREAAALARAAGKTEIEAMANNRADSIAKDLPMLTIALEGDGAITRDGEPVPREAWNTAVPLDPGEHAIVATREGFATWKWRGTIHPAEHLRIAPSFVPMEIAPKKSSSAPLVIGLSTAGAGVVLLAVTGVLAGMAASENASAAMMCPMPDRCTDMMAVARGRDAKSLANAATGTFIAGAAFAAIGFGIAFAWPRGESK